MIHHQHTLPKDVYSTIMNCKLTFTFKKYRNEPNGNITIYRNPRTDKIEHLNATGTLLFRLSKRGATIEKMIETLMLKYKWDSLSAHAAIMKDVFVFIRSLERRGLARVIWPRKS
jgi:hypothetical protein